MFSKGERESMMRRYLVAGLMVWVPLGVTFFVLKWLIELMDGSLALLPDVYQPSHLLGFHIPGFGLLFLLSIVLVTGVITANTIGKYFLRYWEELMERIPIVRTIYSAVQKVVTGFVATDDTSFNRVLLVEYPSKGLWTVAFQTSDRFVEAEEQVGEGLVMAFVPTTPNPTSGFVICFPKNSVKVLDMSVDEALNLIISLGVVVPSQGQVKAVEVQSSS